MSGNRVRLRTPWLDEGPGSRFTVQQGPPRRRGPKAELHRPGSEERPAEDDGAVLRGNTRVPMWVGASAFACGVLGIAGIVLAAGGNQQALSALVTGPLLLGLVYLIARRFAIADRNPQIVPILLGAF